MMDIVVATIQDEIKRVEQQRNERRKEYTALPYTDERDHVFADYTLIVGKLHGLAFALGAAKGGMDRTHYETAHHSQ